MLKKKKKFRPIITRVKLNPEQAVLQCPCYNAGYQYNSAGSNVYPGYPICSGKSTTSPPWVSSGTVS